MKKLIQIETKLASLIEMVGVDKMLHFLVGLVFVLAGLMYGLGFSNSPAGCECGHDERISADYNS